MPYLVAFKKFFFKKTFDFNRPDISLYNFHPQLKILLALKGIFFNNQKTILGLVWPTFCILLSCVGIGLEGMFIYRGISTKDYSFATESFCYLIIILTTPIVYLSLFYYKERIVQFFEHMNDDFKFICSLGPMYRTPFLNGQLLIWKLCYSWLILATFTGGAFLIFPVLALVYQTLFVMHTENTIRPLSFPIWLPNDDPYRTPNYEIFLFIEMNFCLMIVQTFGVYIYTLFHILLHCYFVLDMMILDFRVIFDNLDEFTASLLRSDPRRNEMRLSLNRRVKRIVKWHQSVFKIIETVSLVYGPTLVYQVMFSSFLLCLIGYQIAEDLDKGSVNFLFCLLGVCSCMQLWIPCYLGTLLRNKGFAVGDACWNCGWHNNSLGKLLRSDIILIILRTQKPLLIKFGGLPNVELETFSSITSAAYSYFNMLRQNSH